MEDALLTVLAEPSRDLVPRHVSPSPTQFSGRCTGRHYPRSSGEIGAARPNWHRAQDRRNEALECELKYALEDEAAYVRLEESLGQPAARLQQQNLYLDVPGGNPHGSLRLRSTKNEATAEEKLYLTYKLRHAASHFVPTAYFVAEEYEALISRADWDAILRSNPGERQWELEPLKKLSEHTKRAAPCLIGGTQNLRLVYPGILPNGSVAELDRTTFPGNRTDYELEVETDDPAPVQAWLTRRFGELGLALRAQTKTKNQRFVEQLTALRSGSTK